MPTVRFPDGTALTNPSVADVKQRLASALPATRKGPRVNGHFAQLGR